MLSILDAQEMKELDELATRRYGMPSLLLMEEAGRSVIEELELRFGSVGGKTLLVLAGKGNNGGDGFVAARHAVHRGASVALFLTSSESDLKGDAKTNYDLLRASGSERVQLLRSLSAMARHRGGYDFIVDAIFGTSFHGAVGGKLKPLIEWINRVKGSKIISIDIPSGIEATTGECRSVAVRADLTVTMALPKIGLYTGRGPEYSGAVAIADIHMPELLGRGVASQRFLVEETDVARGLPNRPVNAHKHSVGKIFVLAGSKGFSGAALLCSQAAMKSGAGAVVLGIPASVFPAVARRTLEVMPFELPSTNEGAVAFSAADRVEVKNKWSDVTLIGPGLSQDPETKALVDRIVISSRATLVIDADGLNSLAGSLHLLKRRKCDDIILTPHLGEFSRLVALRPSEIEGNKIEIARAFARQHRVVLVLKGAPTIVATPSGEVFVNSTGNAGMATAGSGDVLGGIIASLAGQGNSAVEAAVNGVFVHGRAGDMARDEIGEMGMLASDILTRVPLVLKQLQAKKRVVGT